MRSLAVALLLFASTGGKPPALTPLAKAAELNAEAVEAQNADRYDEAETYRRAMLEALKEVPDYPLNEWARQLSNLASLLNLTGRPEEALGLLTEARETLPANPSVDPGQYITLDQNLGRAYALLRELAQVRSELAADTQCE